MRIELHTTTRLTGGPAPASDHNRLAGTVNNLQQQLSGAAVETFVSNFTFATLGGWTATNGTANVSSNTLVLNQTGATVVSANVTQTATVGLLYGVRAMIKGDSTSSGKFVQLGISNGTSYTQLSQPVMLSTSYQEIMAIVPAAGTNLTLSITGVDTVSGNNITVQYVEVVTIKTPVVTTSGRQILKNGVPVRYRGMNHSNVPIGYDYNHYFWQEPKQSRYDLQDIAAGGFNCIKVYFDTFNRQGYGAFLDECYRNSLDVLMCYYAPQQTDYSIATGGANRTTQINAYSTNISNVIYHPAVIGYAFGNEMNFNFNLLSTVTLTDLYSMIDAAAVAAKAIDSTRVYTTLNGEIGTLQQYDSALSHLDVWMATIYRGTQFGDLDIKVLAYTQKPFMVAEYGYDRYNHKLNGGVGGEDEAGQAVRDVSLTKDLDGMRSVAGRFTFEWADEWWKEQLAGNTLTTHDHVGSQNYNDDRDQMYDEEWFGMTEALNTGSAQPRVKKQTYLQLQQYQLATPLYSPTLTVETVSSALANPGGFIMRDANYVNYQVQVTNFGILAITPLYVLYSDSATTPILRLDAAHVVTTTYAGHTVVDTWQDQSGNSKNATQYNNSNKPWIVAGPGGYNALRFNGSGQFMELFNLPYGNNVTIFIVAANQRTNLGNGVDTLISNVPAGGVVGGVALNTYSQYSPTPTQRAFAADGGGSYDNYNPSTQTLLVDGTTTLTLSLGVFKVLTYQGANINAHNYTRLGLYTDGQLNGINDISEVIIYQGAMTNTQRSAVESSLMTKYGI